jgi:chromosome segregation ATPase
MSTEPQTVTTGWTLDTLYAHLMSVANTRHEQYRERFESQTKAIDAALAAQRTAVDAALAAAQRATSKAEDAAEKRFSLLNELRGALSDQAARFITREEVDASIARTTERVQELTDRINKSEGRGAGLNAGWAYLVAAVGLASAVVGIFITLNA